MKVEYHLTGGGITGLMDTATFELFRAACRVFYTSFPEDQGTCEITDSDSNNASAVQHSYKVRRTADGLTTGYTLNLYPTKNRLLINGRDIDQLMDAHLPLLHEIMCTPVRTGKLASANQLNHILGTQLQSVLDSRQQRRSQNGNDNSKDIKPSDHISSNNSSNLQNQEVSNVSTPTDITPGSPDLPMPESKKCTKCLKNCWKRGTVCEMGNHWIHYRCDKLTEDEIFRVEKVRGYIYNCKQCQKENTVVKEPAQIAYRARNSPNTEVKNNKSPARTLILPSIITPETHQLSSSDNCVTKSPSRVLILPSPPKRSEQTSPAITEAAGILEEELGSSCHICSDRIFDNETSCDKCQNTCHRKCLVSNEHSDICIACCATDSQLNHQKGTILSQTTSDNLGSVSINCDNINRPGNSKTSEQSSKNNKQPNSNISKQTSTDSNANMKQRELRQLETKLRKWEDDLKIRELKLSDKDKENRRLEDYINKVEARNNELQQTIRTLQRKISLLEPCNFEKSKTTPLLEKTFNCSTIQGTEEQNHRMDYQDQSRNQPRYVSDHTDRLVAGVRDQVTNFILNRVSQQISVLEHQCTEQPYTNPGLSAFPSQNAYQNMQIPTHRTETAQARSDPTHSAGNYYEAPDHGQDYLRQMQPSSTHRYDLEGTSATPVPLMTDIQPVQVNRTTNGDALARHSSEPVRNVQIDPAYYQGQPIINNHIGISNPPRTPNIMNNTSVPPPFLFQVPPPKILR